MRKNLAKKLWEEFLEKNPSKAKLLEVVEKCPSFKITAAQELLKRENLLKKDLFLILENIGICARASTKSRKKLVYQILNLFLDKFRLSRANLKELVEVESYLWCLSEEKNKIEQRFFDEFITQNPSKQDALWAFDILKRPRYLAPILFEKFELDCEEMIKLLPFLNMDSRKRIPKLVFERGNYKPRHLIELICRTPSHEEDCWQLFIERATLNDLKWAIIRMSGGRDNLIFLSKIEHALILLEKKARNSRVKKGIVRDLLIYPQRICPERMGSGSEKVKKCVLDFISKMVLSLLDEGAFKNSTELRQILERIPELGKEIIPHIPRDIEEVLRDMNMKES
ncbi:MAG: hypothetical protein PHG05_00600 [Candidatus Nanoarchaeia archaeon]|nr:hypothetical protein [Candidatus Nanoarchaeia archaeon]